MAGGAWPRLRVFSVCVLEITVCGASDNRAGWVTRARLTRGETVDS